MQNKHNIFMRSEVEEPVKEKLIPEAVLKVKESEAVPEKVEDVDGVKPVKILDEIPCDWCEDTFTSAAKLLEHQTRQHELATSS